MRKQIIDQLFKCIIFIYLKFVKNFKILVCTNLNTSEILKFESFLEIWQLLEKLIELEKGCFFFLFFKIKFKFFFKNSRYK
jgi:hypothetical protein